MARNRGFTLIELLVVLAIVGILVAVAIPQFHYYLVRSKRMDAVTSLAGIYKAQMAHFAQHDGFLTGENCLLDVCTVMGISDTGAALSRQLGLSGSRTIHGYEIDFYQFARDPGEALFKRFLVRMGKNIDEDAVRDLFVIHYQSGIGAAEGIPVLISDDLML